MESKKRIQKQKLTDTENILVVARGNVDQDQVKWVKVVKRYKFQVVKSPGNVMYSMVIVVKKNKAKLYCVYESC